MNRPNPDFERLVQFADESNADYEARLEDAQLETERLRQEALDAELKLPYPFPERRAEWEAARRFGEADAPPIDFIDTYARWADVVELPREAHEATAIQLIASILNRGGVYIRNGKFKFPMDVWIALLSESGGGRSTSMESVLDVLRVGDEEWKRSGNPGAPPMTSLMRDSRWGSPQAMFEDFSTRSSGLMMWSEIAEKFQMLNSGPFAQYGAKQWITDRYDIWVPPNTVTYRTTGSNPTLPITFSVPTRLNILAGSSKDWFYKFLSSDDSGGGWLPRWWLIHLPPKSRSVARPVDTSPEMIPVLGRWLMNLSRSIIPGTNGDPCEATMPEEIWKDYEVWYKQTEARFESGSNPALAAPYWNRHKGHILKLAVIYAVSMGNGLRVTRAAWDRAVVKARELEESIYKIIEYGATAAGYDLKRYEDRIRMAGAEGLLRSDFTVAFQHDPRREREERLKTLLESGAVHSWMSKTSGRSGQMLVTAEHCGGRCLRCGAG